MEPNESESNKMTFEKLAHDYLFNGGMFESDVTKVIELAKCDKRMEAMVGHWNDDADGYPPVMKAVFTISLKRIALEYIDTNIPLAWFRPVFA